ncbi:unnamed protein product [Victoria cruziana]
MVNEWVNCDSVDTDQLLAVDASSIFYGILPSLTDLASMQLSSQSPTTSSASSSSSSASSSSCCSSCSSSWAVKEPKKDATGSQRSGSARSKIDSTAANSLVQSPASGAAASADCWTPVALQQLQEEGSIDVFDGFEEMDILDGVGILDPSIFSPDENGNSKQEEENCFAGSSPIVKQDSQQDLQDQKDGSSSEELARVFFEWLKSNKESISPEELRNIKLKKSTIESAAKRLGGGKDGMLQLLKLILTWVQNHHLQKKQNPSCHCPTPEDPVPNFPYYYHQYQQQDFAFPNNFNSPWFVAPPYPTQAPFYDTCMASFPSVVGYPGMEMGYGMPSDTLHPFPPPSSSPPSDSAVAPETASWPRPQHFYADPMMGFPHNGASNSNGYNQMAQHPADCMSKSATKEARKKRMARQRRFCFHHRHHHGAEKAALMMVAGEANTGNGGNQTNWTTWSPSPPKPSAESSMARKQTPLERQSTPLDRRQGWKAEKNLRFLLQKVLKQSDVGNLGRIVLPKKEAETHLPQLEARDGISMAMEDIGTSRVWNMRYRFWPNNKSRMYLLENTGDFVRSNGLQEGDFIVIYSDVKCGKYMIRGVKVPRQGAGKAQSKCHRVPSPEMPLDQT